MSAVKLLPALLVLAIVAADFSHTSQQNESHKHLEEDKRCVGRIGTTLSQGDGQACAEAAGFEQCSQTIQKMRTGDTSEMEADACKPVQSFTNCISTLDCPEDEKKVIISGALASLKTQSIECAGLGTGWETDAGTGSGVGMVSGKESQNEATGIIGEACTAAIQQCTKNFATKMSDELALKEEPCKIVQSFMDCIFTSPCQLSEDQMQQMINQVFAPLKLMGIECSGLGSEPGAGTGGGAGMGFPTVTTGLSKACATGLEQCLGSLLEKIVGVLPKQPCKILNPFINCIFHLDCPIPDSLKQMIYNQAMTPLKDRGVNCVPMYEVASVLKDYACVEVLDKCDEKFKYPSPDCGSIKEASRCMLEGCDDIKGTEDEKKVAGLLSSTGEERGCNFTADELNSSMGVTTTNTPDAGIGVLKRPVWESLAVLMAAVLLKKILV